MSWPARAGLALAVWTLGACSIEEPAASGTAAIVNGSPSTGDPAVAALVARRSSCEETEPALLCTATLIAPRVAFTAGHCLDVLGEDGAYELLFGSSIGDPDAELVVVSAVEVHPDRDPVTFEYDVALLLLAEPGPVDPLPLATTADGLALAASVRAVGFGQTKSADPDGIKRTGSMEISAIDVASFEAIPSPAMSCIGDSGGPVLADVGGEEQVVGVTVSGDVGCDEYSLNVRADVLAAFVDPFVAAAETAPPGRNPDALAHDALCEAECTTNADCPDGLRCELILDLPGQCVLSGLTAGTFGDECATDLECGDDSECARLWPSGAGACRCHVSCDSAPDTASHEGGGGFCSTGGPSSSPGGWIVVLLVCLGLRRDRSSFQSRR